MSTMMKEKKAEVKAVQEEIPVKEIKSKEPAYKIEQWAKARFNYVEMSEYPGSIWKCSPQGKREEFKDGEIYHRPVGFFEMMNSECRVQKRKLVKPNDETIGKYVKTTQFASRIRFDIIEVYDKKIPIVKKEG